MIDDGNTNGGSLRQPPTRVFSLRLTDDERALLQARAGSTPLGAYIRQTLLTNQDRGVRLIRQRSPVADHEAISRVLASLGQSRLSSNLNQLAKAVHLGVLPVTPETEQEIAQACAAIGVMRNDLIAALGLKPS